MRANWNLLPKTGEEWKPVTDAGASATIKNVPGIAARMKVKGSSAGGALTLAMMLKAKQDGIPLPGAIAPGTPMSDVTKAGDTFETNAMVDHVLVSPDGFCDAGTKVYAKGHDLKDPLLSPVSKRFCKCSRVSPTPSTTAMTAPPETHQAFEEIAAFFDKYLGKEGQWRSSGTAAAAARPCWQTMRCPAVPRHTESPRPRPYALVTAVGRFYRRDLDTTRRGATALL